MFFVLFCFSFSWQDFCNRKEISDKMEWKNLGYEIYKERKGEEEFKRKMEEADTVGRKGNYTALSKISLIRSL